MKASNPKNTKRPPVPARSGSRPTEFSVALAPVRILLDSVLRHIYLVAGFLLLLYLLSGITVVASDEVVLLLRWGRLVGDTPGQATHQPGLLFAFPRPIDEVIRLKVKKIYELEIRDLHFAVRQNDDPTSILTAPGRTIDPEKSGYCLTGDNNVIQALLMAKYQIDDPIQFAFLHSRPQDLLKDVVMAAMVRSVAEKEVDDVLSEGRKLLASTVRRRAQKRLDTLGAGMILLSLEFTDLVPPRQVMDDFKKVQSAFIDKETKLKEAQKYREEQVPRAQADKSATIREAQAYANDVLSRARGDADAFRSLIQEYHKNPRVIKERLYRESIEKILAKAGKTRFVPPPEKGSYDDFRITIPTGG